MLPVIYLALLIGRWRRLGDHGIQVPTMVLLSLLTVGGTDTEFTYLTIVETLAGGVIGVLTNAIVLAPLHIQQPRDQIRAMTMQVCQMLNDMAAGLRDGWDSEWLTSGTTPAPTSSRWRPASRRRSRPDGSAPSSTPVTTCSAWRSTGRATRRRSRRCGEASGRSPGSRDENESQPAPTQRFLENYAQVLDEIAGAISHFGLPDAAEREAVATYLRTAAEILDRLGNEVRTTDLEDPQAWPAYGAMLIDAQRLIRELEVRSHQSVMPTDSGPFRKPPRRIVSH